jgi:hypothetical protein
MKMWRAKHEFLEGKKKEKGYWQCIRGPTTTHIAQGKRRDQYELNDTT